MSGTSPTDRLTPIDDDAGRTVYYDETTETYHTWCADGAYEPASTALLLAVSSIRDVEPDELEALSERVDPDAVNATVAHWRDADEGVDGTISFSFADCAITIRASGEIVIDPDDRAS